MINGEEILLMGVVDIGKDVKKALVMP